VNPAIETINHMNSLERQQAIIKHLDVVGVCTYQDLARQHVVSEMTIRRDVDKLVQRGGVIKTLGGVQTARAPAYLYESPIQERMLVHATEKEQIADTAMQAIRPRQTIFLDGGTTCLVLARHLAKKAHGLTVVTHSALVCIEFGRVAESGNTVLMLGGQLDATSECFVGPTAEEFARRFFVDVAFFSTKGFLPQEGTFESSIATIRIKQIIAEQAAHVVLLADHSKFGQRALCKVLDIKQIHEVVTDSGVTASDLALMEQIVVTVRAEQGDPLTLEVANHAC
jgi:DeoR/GlpR family transcriptional regulator of sugar metabolism